MPEISRLLPLHRLSWMTKPRALASGSALLLNLVFFYLCEIITATLDDGIFHCQSKGEEIEGWME